MDAYPIENTESVTYIDVVFYWLMPLMVVHQYFIPNVGTVNDIVTSMPLIGVETPVRTQYGYLPK